MKTKGIGTSVVAAIIVIVIAIAGIGIYLVKRDEIPSGKIWEVIRINDLSIQVYYCQLLLTR